MNRRSILAAYKKKSSHLQTGVTGFKSGNLFIFVLPQRHLPGRDFLVQENPAQINTKMLIVSYPYPHTLHQHGSCQS